MTQPLNRRFVLAGRPHGAPIPEPTEGKALLRLADPPAAAS